MKRSALVLGLLGLITAGSIAGCGEESAPGPAAAKKPATASAAAVVAAADGGTQLAALSYAYNPLGKRDPFRAFQEEARVLGESGQVACLEPLCQFDLDSLALVAVVSGDSNPVAMLEDSAKTGYLIRRNSRIGKQGGKVTQILRDCIIVTEYWVGPDGKSNANPVRVCVKADKSDAPPLDLMNPQKQY